MSTVVPIERPAPTPRSAGLRLGLLFGPSIFGVSAAGVALPAAASTLGITPSTAAWILTVHALALGVGTALFGRLVDTWGARRALLTGSVVLTAGAVVCLLAPDLGTLLAGRFLLAAGSGAMTSGAVTMTAAGDPQRRGAVLAWFGAVVAVFAGSATLVGGMVTAAVTWRVALVLPVLSLVGVALSLRVAPTQRGGGRVDVVGAVLLTLTAAAGLVLLQAPALRLAVPAVAALAVLVVAAAAALARWVRRTPEGFVPRALLGSGPYLRAAAAGAGVFGGLFAAMYAAPALLVTGRGWSVLAVGAALLPGAALSAVASRLAGRLTPSGGRLLLATAAAATALALVAAGLTAAPGLVVGAASLAFVAFSTAQVVLTAQAAAAVAPPQRGAGMGLLTLTFMVGGAVGSATAGGFTGAFGVGPALAVAAVLPLAAAVVAVTNGSAGTDPPRG
ncbi:MFS transporter [Pseudonocardia nigra]|uniref:MFS transporter n=1 Tax=Pseudonocardia nigra TaxID=1921578 RepID=UPI001C5FEFB0|nr:MFS transporter [Pseudonocardia nigra]